MNFGNKASLRNSLIINPAAGDIGSPTNGEVWYNSSTGKFRKHEGGTTSNLDTSTPGGSNTEVQFNNSGVFGGSSNFTWDNSSGALSILNGSSNANLYMGNTNARIYSEAGIGEFYFYSGANILARFGLTTALIKGALTLTSFTTIQDNGDNISTLRLNTGVHNWYIQNNTSSFEIQNITGGGTPFRINSSGRVGIGGSPNASSILDVQSTTAGVLLPRMTSSERTTIGTPSTGLILYQTNSTENLYIKKSTAWKRILTEDDSIGTGQSAIQFKDEGTDKGTSGGITSVNFVGAGVTATDSGAALTVTIPGGGGAYTVTTVTGATHNETATSGEVIIRCDTTSNNITVNLPTAVGNTAKITIKRISSGSNTLTLDGDASETIDGGTTALLRRQYESVTLYSTNTNWEIM